MDDTPCLGQYASAQSSAEHRCTHLAVVERPRAGTITVTRCGRICLGRRKINLIAVFAGQNIGIKEVSEKIWLVTFMHYDIGFFDHEAARGECAAKPFDAKVLPMSPYKPLPM
jgi:hypothetical protein